MTRNGLLFTRKKSIVIQTKNRIRSVETIGIICLMMRSIAWYWRFVLENAVEKEFVRWFRKLNSVPEGE